MKISVVAVGLKIPKWADEACEDYLHRFPSDWEGRIKDRQSRRQEHAHHPESDAGRSGKVRAALPKVPSRSSWMNAAQTDQH